MCSDVRGGDGAQKKGAPVAPGVGAWAGRGNVTFTPQLPASKVSAIESIGFGVLDKV